MVKQAEKCHCSDIVKSVRTGICSAVLPIVLTSILAPVLQVYFLGDSLLNYPLNLPSMLGEDLKARN